MRPRHSRRAEQDSAAHSDPSIADLLGPLGEIGEQQQGAGEKAVAGHRLMPIMPNSSMPRWTSRSEASIWGKGSETKALNLSA